MVDHVRILNGVTISNGWPFFQLPFENRTKMSGFLMAIVLYHSKFDPQNVRFLMIPDFEWSDFKSHCNPLETRVRLSYLVETNKFTV